MLAHGTHNNFILNLCFHSFCFSETFAFKSKFVHGVCALEGFENVVEKLSSAFELCHLLARVLIQESTRNRVVFYKKITKSVLKLEGHQHTRETWEGQHPLRGKGQTWGP